MSAIIINIQTHLPLTNTLDRKLQLLVSGKDRLSQKKYGALKAYKTDNWWFYPHPPSQEEFLRAHNSNNPNSFIQWILDNTE